MRSIRTETSGERPRYSLNHDLKTLQQKQSSNKPIVKASTDYCINEREQPPTYQMSSDINDIMKIKTSKGTKEVNLVARDNDLTALYFDLSNSGYEAGIAHQADFFFTDIKLRTNKVTYIEKQHIIKSSADGRIAVDDEDVYNNMILAMYNFNKAISNPF